MSLSADSLSEAHAEWVASLGDAAPAGPDGAVVEPAWRIDGDREAAWALRKAAAAQAELDRLEAAAQAEREAIDEWLAAARRPVDSSRAYFESLLLDYRRRLEAADPSLPATYKLPGGDLQRRAGRRRLEVVDEAAFIEWAEQHLPAAVPRKVLVSALSKIGAGPPVDLDRSVAAPVVTADGEIVPGVTSPPAPDSYSVKLRPIVGGAA